MHSNPTTAIAREKKTPIFFRSRMNDLKSKTRAYEFLL